MELMIDSPAKEELAQKLCTLLTEQGALLRELAVSYGVRVAERRMIKSPSDAFDFVLPTMSVLEQEEVHVILLDAKNQVLTIEIVTRGGINMSMVSPPIVFREAVRQNAVSLILCHNHPSGVPEPSPEDLEVTRMLVAAGKIMGIEVLDHLIVGGKRYVSLKERNPVLFDVKGV